MRSLPVLSLGTHDSMVTADVLDAQALGHALEITHLCTRCRGPTERARAGVVLPRVWLGLAALS